MPDGVLDEASVFFYISGHGLGHASRQIEVINDGGRGIESKAVNLYDADLIRAVDIVITKPGYGIVSDCLANDTAMLYTSRGVFPEYERIVAEIPCFLRCEHIDLDAFLAGRWREGLNRVLQRPAPAERPRTDGASRDFRV